MPDRRTVALLFTRVKSLWQMGNDAAWPSLSCCFPLLQFQ